MSLQVDLVKPEGSIDGDEHVTEVLPQWRAWHMKKAKKGIEIKTYYEPKRVKIYDVDSIGRSLPPGFMNAVNELLQHVLMTNWTCAANQIPSPILSSVMV